MATPLRKTEKEIVNAIKHAVKIRAKYKIEIVKSSPIKGGIEVYARVWEKGKQIGFGKDGTVDIERFRIFNPPTLIEDPNSDIVREWVDDLSGRKVRTLKEDTEEAILQSLEHIISVKKEKHSDSNIITGRVGNTTSTFYPSVDGYTRHQQVISSWATMQAAAGTNGYDYQNPSNIVRIETLGTNWYNISRGIFIFDTSAIDTDTISSATLSIYGTRKDNNWSGANSFGINVYSAAPASDATIAAGDHDSLGSVEFSTTISFASYSDAGFNDFSLNASGLAAINKTGNSRFGFREANYDAPDVEPSKESSKNVRFYCYTAEQTGTANDPKLVVEHAGGGGSTFRNNLLIGSGL